jgi:hypothetical protein
MSTSKFFMTRIFVFICATASLMGCRDHVINGPTNEEELITTLGLSFTELDQAGEPAGEPIQFFWRDVDASGNPEIDAVLLKAQRSYRLEIAVLDESRTPAVNITAQIIEEALEHQFFFLTDGFDATISYDDSDAAGKPLGVQNIVTTGSPGAGSLTVVLRHEPEKNAPGVQDGEISNAGGETDIEAIFPLTLTE